MLLFIASEGRPGAAIIFRIGFRSTLLVAVFFPSFSDWPAIFYGRFPSGRRQDGSFLPPPSPGEAFFFYARLQPPVESVSYSSLILSLSPMINLDPFLGGTRASSSCPVDWRLFFPPHDRLWCP